MTKGGKGIIISKLQGWQRHLTTPDPVRLPDCTRLRSRPRFLPRRLTACYTLAAQTCCICTSSLASAPHETRPTRSYGFVLRPTLGFFSILGFKRSAQLPLSYLLLRAWPGPVIALRRPAFRQTSRESICPSPAAGYAPRRTPLRQRRYRSPLILLFLVQQTAHRRFEPGPYPAT